MFNFDNSYSSLPETFFARVMPDKVPRPSLIHFNEVLVQQVLGAEDILPQERLAQVFSGQKLLPNSDPIACAYAGHQFGHFVPSLGDGRALLLGEVIGVNQKRFDIQLKGSGPTPFSRRGDGKSPLGPVIREYLLSEAMAALNVPTSRALAAVSTGELVYRQEAYPGAILTRVASSHLRVGTFQYFAYRGDYDSLKILADYTIDRHYPQAKDREGPYLYLLQLIAKKQALLVTKWMSLGFIHGVMNTDNTSICGETIDYGPCAFMDRFIPSKVFSSIDQNGRYGYNKQLEIAKWNLYQLANCLIPLIDQSVNKAIEKTQSALESILDYYEIEYANIMGHKLGLNQACPALNNEWLSYLEKEKLDFTLSYQKLMRDSSAFVQTHQLKKFMTSWEQEKRRQGIDNAQALLTMKAYNPVYIPRNHLVEQAIELAYEQDFKLFKKLNSIWSSPFDYRPELEEFERPPRDKEVVKATFCGT